MKEGTYFRIPERPADIRTLWNQAKLLQPADLPAWLTPEGADSYRYIGFSTWANLPSHEHERYFSELKELEFGWLIVEQDPEDRHKHHIYIAAPSDSEVWSIGMYVGNSPLSVGPPQTVKNPVLTRHDVSDVPATYVADPFMIRADDAWHMFFEVMNWRANKGEIGLAISKDGMRWTYQHIVLAEPFHLSYPHVFEWMGNYYMIPESHQAGAVRLYRATEFPTHWSLLDTLLDGPYLVDASIVRHGNKWWLFAETNPEVKHDTLRLYYADELLGAWYEHPKSPIVRGNPHIARPAGKIVICNERIIRYAQNCHPAYGSEVRAFEIIELTTTRYCEQEADRNPILRPTGAGWNACGMHHIDAHLLNSGQWIACVDGWSSPAAA